MLSAKGNELFPGSPTTKSLLTLSFAVSQDVLLPPCAKTPDEDSILRVAAVGGRRAPGCPVWRQACHGITTTMKPIKAQEHGAMRPGALASKVLFARTWGKN